MLQAWGAIREVVGIPIPVPRWVSSTLHQHGHPARVVAGKDRLCCLEAAKEQLSAACELLRWHSPFLLTAFDRYYGSELGRALKRKMPLWQEVNWDEPSIRKCPFGKKNWDEPSIRQCPVGTLDYEHIKS